MNERSSLMAFGFPLYAFYDETSAGHYALLPMENRTGLHLWVPDDPENEELGPAAVGLLILVHDDEPSRNLVYEATIDKGRIRLTKWARNAMRNAYEHTEAIVKVMDQLEYSTLDVRGRQRRGGPGLPHQVGLARSQTVEVRLGSSHLRTPAPPTPYAHGVALATPRNEGGAVKNYPNQVSNVSRIKAALRVIKQLDQAGSDVSDDGVLGYEAARERAYTFRNMPADASDGAIAQRIVAEQTKPPGNQGPRTFAPRDAPNPARPGVAVGCQQGHA